MKFFMMLLFLLSIFGYVLAGDKSELATTPQFEKMKSLVGKWNGKGGDGKPINVSYKLVSSGSALMETLSMEEHEDAMVTMYYLDGAKLMMTHYCSVGNQPRMRAGKSVAEVNKLVFKFVDATNLTHSGDPHMSGLVVTFKDNDHFTQEWTMSTKGKESDHDTFEFERAP